MNLYTQFKQQEAELISKIEYLRKNKTKTHVIFKTLKNKDTDYSNLRLLNAKLSQFYKDNLFWANEMILKWEYAKSIFDKGVEFMIINGKERNKVYRFEDIFQDIDKVIRISELQQIKQECEVKK